MGKVNTLLAKKTQKSDEDVYTFIAIKELLSIGIELLLRLFGHQYAQEMLLPEGKRSTE